MQRQTEKTQRYKDTGIQRQRDRERQTDIVRQSLGDRHTHIQRLNRRWHKR